jgi:NhaP-type Na+/H+ or K+/H+ antiporter
VTNAGWFLVIGSLLLFMALTAVRIKRLPLSTAIVYIGVGLLLGPSAANQFHVNPMAHSAFLEVATEVAVIVSLFGAGLKLAAPVGDRIWWVPFRLATISMALTVGFMAVIGVALLELPLGAAILLGAILAPTDPVLATEVQVKGPRDVNQLRFSLTGEAGLNDGTAFPMVMLGLGMLGLHDLGDHYERWLLVDVLWASVCGLGVGGMLGAATAWGIHKLGTHGIHSEFMEDFLGLGLIASAYGLALLLLGYGFLAVFAAGFMMHRVELRLDPASAQDSAGGNVGPLSHISLKFVEQLERLGEVAILILVGGMLFVDSWQWRYVAAALLLLFLVRPISVGIGLLGARAPAVTQAAIGWFGVRGIGSFYYLMYAIQHGLEEDHAVTLTSVVLVVIGVSILLHGTTVTGIMNLYSKHAR